MIDKRNRRILIVCHDAGGAEVVSSWVRRNDTHAFTLVVTGPAAHIFYRKLPHLPQHTPDVLHGAVAAADFVLTGTGWASDLEKQAIRMARAQGVKVAAFLDHWARYPERFCLEGTQILPDEIWVGDPQAERLARQSFQDQDTRLRLVPNPYIADLREEVERVKTVQKDLGTLHILYICEPLRAHSLREYGHPDHWGYDEFQALAYFLDKVTTLTGKTVRLRLRLHPSEERSKYDPILSTFDAFPLQKRHRSPLVEDIAWADWVVGQESMALAVSVFLGKRVFSCIPPGGRASCLPLDQIRSLEDHVQAFAVA